MSDDYFLDEIRRENNVIRDHVEMIRQHLKEIEELDGTWNIETEGTVTKFDGTVLPRRTGIRFHGLMHYIDTIWDDEE